MRAEVTVTAARGWAGVHRTEAGWLQDGGGARGLAGVQRPGAPGDLTSQSALSLLGQWGMERPWPEVLQNVEERDPHQGRPGPPCFSV